ncbi:MAG: hypothetical protein MUF49_04095 [Oculatellaceae cyanobacterium Prado106]|jgi:Ca2+-binding RTX toxin-like protein|nr:hypothetical protein [Oculatellaceae cyanobacterium Prado106]
MMTTNASTSTTPTSSIRRRGKRLSEEQRQNLKTLMTDVQNSVDNPASEESIAQLKTTVKTAFSDRTITQPEFQSIVQAVTTVTTSAGVTNPELRVIFYDLQDIAETSRYPRTNDVLTGTNSNDTLWTGLGNDILTGTSAAGMGEVDRLIGGGGKDTFVLGTSTQMFYDDGNVNTIGLNDYATVIDFNLKKDTIQLKGNSNDYVLAAPPPGLGLTGTGIYYTTGQNSATPELVGVVSGVAIADFSTGFTFV